MSHRLIQRLAAVEAEYRATRAALAFTAGHWSGRHDAPELHGVTRSELDAATQNVQATYIVRLFAEFEAILRAQYPATRPGRRLPPTSASLIDAFGSYYRVPAQARDNAHTVRRFRHSIAHADPSDDQMTFSSALSWLNRFLSFIPDADVP
jgi:hypothetical protein